MPSAPSEGTRTFNSAFVATTGLFETAVLNPYEMFACCPGKVVGTDTERLSQALLDDGWLIAPGALFHATPRSSPLMRINFATTQDARFWQRLQAIKAQTVQRGKAARP